MKRINAIVTLLFLVISALFYNNFYQGSAISNGQTKEQVTVTNVIDGDTIVIIGGERVRLLGIDTPEKGEFFYKEAKTRLEQLVEKKNVTLEKEGENKDKYGRLLRYIFIDDTNINLKLVEEGYAICYFYDKSKHQELCKKAEQNAMQNKIGRWQNNSL